MQTRYLLKFVHIVLVITLLGNLALPALAKPNYDLPRPTLETPTNSSSVPALSTWQRAVAQENISCATPSSTPGRLRLFLPLILKSGGKSGTATTAATLEAQALPPDPGTVAPLLDRTVVTILFTATQFLYTGANPIQIQVPANTIKPLQAAVLRGSVHERSGAPLTGVLIKVLDHPEYGCTFSRADGAFDLVVNGGSPLTVSYQKAGYLPAQRQITAPVQDYARPEQVMLLPYDNQVTAINLITTTVQAARGSQITDGDGSRQATILFPAGTQATLVMTNGATQTLTNLNVRATEFTVGPNGPQAMPGDLPAESGYTYAVDYSVDQALAAGAADVRFNHPLYHYVENFLNFPVGTSVPSGYYNQQKGTWVPADNGRVVKIVSISGRLAQIDTDGNGTADNNPALGITDAERTRLASLYSAGQELWRVPIAHFSLWDLNWGWGPPVDAAQPDQPQPGQPGNNTASPEDDPCLQPKNSVIECQNQILGERVDLTGIPFSLNYRSDRVPGRQTLYTIDIPLSRATIPASLKQIELEVLVAGQTFTQTFPAAVSQRTSFTWDGRDAYGRQLQGEQPVTVRIGYTYDAFYQAVERFGYKGNGIPITGDRARQMVTLWQEWQTHFGAWDARAEGLGGWSLDIHHAYDPLGQTLYLGNGERRSTQGVLSTITTVAGTGTASYNGDGGPATAAQLNNPQNVTIGPDGALYIADTNNSRVRRVGSDGVITTVAGNGTPGYSGDGGPATQAQLHNPIALAFGPDGSLYIADFFTQLIRRVGPDGIITTFAGGGSSFADNIPAIQAQFGRPTGVVAAPDGSVYIADAPSLGERVRRVGSDGLITTVVSNTVLWGLGIGPDSSLYPANPFNLVFRLPPGGTLTPFAGTGNPGYSGDGGPANQALIHHPGTVAAGPDGSIYIPETEGHRIRRVGSDGLITTVAGNGIQGYSGDNGPALQARLNGPTAVAVGADNSLYIAEPSNNRIRRVRSAMPSLTFNDIIIPTEDGSQLYIFNPSGRHLRTLNAFTKAILYQFSYDANGRLSQITDGDGNMTTIERDATGQPMGIISPYGQRTILGLNGDGYLTSVTNPASETTQFGYTATGLLTSLTNPRSQTTHYNYDAAGQLNGASDPASGSKTLLRTTTASSYTVTFQTGLNRTTRYQVNQFGTGDRSWLNTAPDGTQTGTLFGLDGSQNTTAPDGMVTGMLKGADPRFGMQAPVVISQTTRTPSGLTATTLTTRTANLTNPADPLSLTQLNNTVSVNGRTYTSLYTAASHQFSLTSPQGRQTSQVIDLQGRTTQATVTGLDPVNYTYDSRGRPATITQGSGASARTVSLSYNSAGFLASLTDPLGRTISFSYDAAGRVTQQILPGNRVIGYGYDANGNVTFIIPPGRTAHTFSYTPVDLPAGYTPPNVNSGGSTQYSYNLDRQLSQITRPDGQTLVFGYDSGGRLSSLTTSTGPTSYTYQPTSGNLATITAPGGSTLAYSYDGSLLTGQSWAGPVAGSIGYTYDNNFRVIARSVNGGNTVNFQYDNDSLLTQAGSLSLSRSVQNGLLTSSTLGNVTDARSYNSFGEPLSYTARYNGSNLYTTQYSRDKLGRITAKTETIGGVTTVYSYTYDLAGRLIGVQQNGTATAAYTYDANGNRLTGPGGVTGSYDNQDRLLQYGTTVYSYTANGELKSKTSGGQPTTYNYDVLGNLITVTLPISQISYLVDGQNRRIGKKVNGTLVSGWLYEDDLRPAAQLDGAGNIVSQFIYAIGINVPDYMVRSGVTYRLVTDHLGSVHLVVNTATGAIAQRLDYDEFGRVLADTNPGFQPFGFAGGLYDPDTGLVRFGTRDYDPVVGRWTAKDPIGFGGRDTNLYTYVGNEPIARKDLYGLSYAMALPELGPVGIAVGVGIGIGLLYCHFNPQACRFPSSFPPNNPSNTSSTSIPNSGGQCLMNDSSKDGESEEDEDKKGDNGGGSSQGINPGTPGNEGNPSTPLEELFKELTGKDNGRGMSK